MPSRLGGVFCVVVRDANTYAESVVISSVDANNQQLFIQRDPTFISSRPVISPPSGSSEGLLVAAASVTISGLEFRTALGTIAYGLRASSTVTISSVGVFGGFTAAGIVLSSGSLLTYSSATVPAGTPSGPWGRTSR